MDEVVVQLKFNQVRTRDPVSVNVRVAFEQGEGERGASEQDVRSAGDVIIGSVNALAELDPSNDLQGERDSLQFETDGEETEGARYSKNELKDGFKQIGDDIHRTVWKFTQEITKQENITHVIRRMLEELDKTFEVKDGKGVINSGRLLMALYLNFGVIVNYYKQHGRERLIPFLVELIPSLVKYLVKIGLIIWIIEVGGWLIVREITKTDVAVSTVFRSVKHLPKLGIYFGAAWLAWKVVKYFWQET